MGRKIDLTSKIFGRLTVISEAEATRGKNGQRVINWNCKCSCGNAVICPSSRLASGNTRSCGCYGLEARIKSRRSHGASNSKTYLAWRYMLTRCNNPNNNRWHRYGGRGIKVCDRWSSFANFLIDMGETPDGTSLDRINTNGNYEPGNCRWADNHTQSRNRCNNHNITFDGRTQCIQDWAAELGVNRVLLRDRINKLGWSTEKALSTPHQDSRLAHRNMPNTTFLTIGEITKSLPEWCETSPVTLNCVRCRLKLGWPVEDALNCPNGIKLKTWLKRKDT